MVAGSARAGIADKMVDTENVLQTAKEIK